MVDDNKSAPRRGSEEYVAKVKQVAELLQREIVLQGKTQAAVALKAGKTGQYLSEILSGKHTNAKVTTLIPYADALGVAYAVRAIFYGDEYPDRIPKEMDSPFRTDNEDFALLKLINPLLRFDYTNASSFYHFAQQVRKHNIIRVADRLISSNAAIPDYAFRTLHKLADFIDNTDAPEEHSDRIFSYLLARSEEQSNSSDKLVLMIRSDLYHGHSRLYEKEEVSFCQEYLKDDKQRVLRAEVCNMCLRLRSGLTEGVEEALDILKNKFKPFEKRDYTDSDEKMAELVAIVRIHEGKFAYLLVEAYKREDRLAERGIIALREARRILKEVSAYHPFFAHISFLQGRLLQSMNHYEEAEKHLLYAKKIFRDNIFRGICILSDEELKSLDLWQPDLRIF
jgi:transcriptional regulator with XRE-family HTH domain